MKKRPLFHQLMLQEEYFREYHRQFDCFLKTYFENGVFEQKVDEITELISPYVAKDPTAFCSFEDYETGVETIRNFCLLRAQSVRGQLNGEIPSTIRGQSVDQSSFVDASSVWIPDMGEIAGSEGSQRRRDGDGPVCLDRCGLQFLNTGYTEYRKKKSGEVQYE